jgi:hypothetical protein
MNQRRRPSRRAFALIATATCLTVLQLTLAASASAQAKSQSDATELRFVVDSDLRPPASQLPPVRDGGRPRPVAALVGPAGAEADFAADELIVVGDDEAALQGLLERWRGTVLTTIEPSRYGFDELPARHLVSIDPRLADTSALARDLTELNRDARGEHRVSSEVGLGLLAVAARERLRGLEIDLNWLEEKMTFPGRSAIEAAGIPDAYQWPEFCHSPSPTAACGLDIGVAEAWTVLQKRGVLPPSGVMPTGRRIPIAIVDSGFVAFDADSPAGSVQLAPVGPDFTNCSMLCPFHGALVTSAATAVPDNSFGTAGSGGPVGRAVRIADGGTMATDETAILAGAASSRIINMSFGGEIPAAFVAFKSGFEKLVQGVRDSGVLLFAAAGNDGVDVDRLDCFIGCWEAVYHWPCETAGVICVGGLAFNSRSRDPASNVGSGGLSPEQSVDIWAPFDVMVGPDPSVLGPSVMRLQGTSFSSPFAAGVAALVWAAGGGIASATNPTGLTANQVENILLSESHGIPGTSDRYVWAWKAVKAALGNAPPVASAGPDQVVNELSQVTLDGTTSSDPDDGQLTFAWEQVGGPPVNASTPAPGRLSFTTPAVGPGGATLAFRLVVNNGVTASQPDDVTITVQDSAANRTAPVLTVPATITQSTPNLGGTAVTYTASAIDQQDPHPVVSCTPPSGSTFPIGETIVTCTATDSDGDTTTATFTVVIERSNPCPGKPWQCD